MKNSSARTPGGKPGTSAASRRHFPVVGIGASAGGLEAFTQLVRHLPGDTGMAFVLVQHLDPGHSSALPQILSKTTSLPVREVTNNLRVKPDHIYIIPPNTRLSLQRGLLKLEPRLAASGSARSIDSFFESLAQDQHECAIGVILSGAASDGTHGLEAIKAEGGITFAQDDSAAYDSMPRSAIAAGCVDFILPPDQIVTELVRIAKHPVMADALRSASAAKTKKAAHTGQAFPLTEALPVHDGFKKVLLLLRNHAAVDFSLYKPSTILRRINRRIVLNKLSSIDAYAQFLRYNARELDALYSDVLINVTGFFRNPDAFDVLKRTVFPKLIPARRDAPVRFWVLGCSSGQEPYSLAMAFMEFCDRVPRAPKLQIFATDINDALLDKARSGLYARSLLQDVAPERLRRFFVEQEGGFRVAKPVRDTVVFARQNLLSDPPFSRMDLITCRNLLIYIEAGLQRKILPTFHYALKPGGFLFLGASESIGPFSDLFEIVDKKRRIYSRKPGLSPPLQLRMHPGPAAGKKETAREALQMAEGIPRVLSAQREADRVTRNRYAPPGVLINSALQILQFRGDTGPYLKPPAGQATFNVLKMAREGLMLPLRAAINKAKRENKVARMEKIRVKQDGHVRIASLEVVPLKNLKERCYLISFEDPSAASRTSAALVESIAPSKKRAPRGQSRFAELESELEETRDHLQSLQEQAEAANEELQASNEEITSANEELQSLNEELETSKEELESANEELTTLNDELGNRNSELNRLNSDLVNLQTSTQLAILLLGRDLTVRRFSAQAEKQFHLQASDIGRPIANIRHDLDIPDLENFVAGVIAAVREAEREVRDKQGRWFSLRARPYLSLDNQVDGAVLVLVDIDALKRSQQDLLAARDYATDTVDTVREPLIILDSKLRVESANRSYYRHFRASAAETVGRLIYDLGKRQWDIPEFRRLLEEILPRDTAIENLEVEVDLDQRGRRTILINARRIDDLTWTKQRILLVLEDMTERKQAQMKVEAARISEAILATARDPLLILDSDLRVHSANGAFYHTFKASPGETARQSLFDLGGGRWKIPRLRELLENVIPRNSFFDNFEISIELDGRRRTFLLDARKLKDQSDLILLGIQDITEVLHFQAEVRQSEARKDAVLRSALDAIITLDQEGLIAEFNPAAEKILGCSQADAMGRSLADLAIPERLRPDFVVSLENFMATGQGPMLNRQVELTALRADGTEFAAELSIVAMPDGQPRLFTVFLRDITERKRSEKAIANQARLLDWSNDAIIVRDVEGSIFWNQGAEKLYRLAPLRSRGPDDSFLVAHRFPKPFDQMIDKLFRNNNVTRRTRPDHPRDGRRITVLSRWTVNPEKHSAVLILRSDTNITERKRADVELRQAQALLADRAALLEQTVQERTAKLGNRE